MPVPIEYWEQRLARHRGLGGVGYIGLGLAFNQWAYRIRRTVFLREVTKLMGNYSEATALDIGSGTGFWIDVWSTLGLKSVTASDITAYAAANLRQKFPHNRVIQHDISSIDAVNALGTGYDFVSAIDVLFHIISDSRYSLALSNVARVLKPGGFFIFSENLPHRQSLRSATQVNRTLEEVTRVLGRCGLTIRRRVPMFFLMNTPVDCESEFVKWAWKIFMTPLQFAPVLGHLYGAGLYPLEFLFTRLIDEGPSTELVICQKSE